MSKKITAKPAAILALTDRDLPVRELFDIAGDDNPDKDERKAARMMIAIGRIIREPEELSK